MVDSYRSHVNSVFSNELRFLTPQPGDEVEFVVVQNQKTRKMSACSLRRIWLVYSFTLDSSLFVFSVLVWFYFPELPNNDNKHLKHGNRHPLLDNVSAVEIKLLQKVILSYPG